MIWRAVVGIGALGMTPDEELQMRVRAAGDSTVSTGS